MQPIAHNSQNVVMPLELRKTFVNNSQPCVSLMVLLALKNLLVKAILQKSVVVLVALMECAFGKVQNVI